MKPHIKTTIIPELCIWIENIIRAGATALHQSGLGKQNTRGDSYSSGGEIYEKLHIEK